MALPALQQRSSAALPKLTRTACPRRLHCKAAAPGGGGGSINPPGQPSREDVLARINKAREYSKSGSGSAAPKVTSAQAAAAAPPPPLPPAVPAPAAFEPPIVEPTSEDVLQTFRNAAQAAAQKEEAQFLQAFSQAQRNSRAGGSGGSGAPAQVAPAARPGSSAADSKEAMLARISAARQYKKQGADSPGGSASASSRPGVPAVQPPPPPPQRPNAAAAQQAAQQQAQQAQQAQQERPGDDKERSFRTGAGNAGQAANWLVFAEGDDAPPIDTSLSAEQFTIAKDAQKKRQGVDIISVDAGYDLQVKRAKRAQQGGGSAADQAAQEQEEGDEFHKPAVATWGVFPRPRNISEAYGGGRNLRPGQALESEDAAAERQQRVSAALKEYRKTLGLDIDPAVESRAQALYDEGKKLFADGLVSSALPKFEAATELMVLRSRLGGESRLQQAICLDSLGRNQEAFELYRKVESHSAPGVAKTAKRMLFGWKAADQLKVQNLSYRPPSSQWKRYFDAINRNSVYTGYVAADREEEGGGGADVAAVALAVAVMLLPLGFVAYRVLLP